MQRFLLLTKGQHVCMSAGISSSCIVKSSMQVWTISAAGYEMYKYIATVSPEEKNMSVSLHPRCHCHTCCNAPILTDDKYDKKSKPSRRESLSVSLRVLKTTFMWPANRNKSFPPAGVGGDQNRATRSAEFWTFNASETQTETDVAVSWATDKTSNFFVV